MSDFDPYKYVSTRVHGGVREIVGEEAEKIRERVKERMMSDRVSELAIEALHWSYKKYQTDTSGYDREYWYAQRLAQLVVEECISVVAQKEFKEGFYIALVLTNHFEMKF